MHKVNFKPRFLYNNTIETRNPKNMKMGWTMVLCFSRYWCVRRFFLNFEKLEFDRAHCHLLIYNNTNDKSLDNILLKYCRRYHQGHKPTHGRRNYLAPFASVRLYKSFRPYGGIVFGQEAEFDKSKLPIIYEMQRDIANMITTRKFFMLEDDTLPPEYAVKRLFYKLERSKNIGLVSGVEPTRSPRLTDKARIGAYNLLWGNNKILERVSLSPDLRGHQECDAVGFYCLAGKTKAWRMGKRNLENIIEVQKTAEPNWAIDTLWTNMVKTAGYKVFADFDTPCLHMQSIGDKIYFWAIDRAVVKLDYYIEKYNCYAQGIELCQKKKKN